MESCNAFADINKTPDLAFYNACQFGKNHLRHFDSVETKTTELLQLIYAYLWSPSHSHDIRPQLLPLNLK